MKSKLLDAHGRQPGAAAERIVADADERGIAPCRQVIGAGGDEPGADCVNQAAFLQWSAHLLERRTAYGQPNDIGVDWRRQILHAVAERYGAKPVIAHPLR